MTPLERDEKEARREKDDAAGIREFMHGLAAALDWPKTDQRYNWPQNIYRFDNVTAVADILLRGCIYSRAKAVTLGLLSHDAADPEIIAQSVHAHKYARLYFGPRTPTQFNTEGIRPARAIRAHGAHCPVPVFLIFNAPELLASVGVSFSNGNIAATRHRIGSSLEFLEDLPWDMIYHRGPMPGEQKSDITFHRNAEVLVEDQLDLSLLRAVVCRTGPERDTLLDLLGSNAIAWDDQIRITRPGEDIFERKYYSVEDVQLNESAVVVRPRFALLGPFLVHARFIDPVDDKVIRDIEKRVESLGTLEIGLPRPVERVKLELRIDGYLAYRGEIGAKQLLGSHTMFNR